MLSKSMLDNLSENISHFGNYVFNRHQKLNKESVKTQFHWHGIWFERIRRKQSKCLIIQKLKKYNYDTLKIS